MNIQPFIRAPSHADGQREKRGSVMVCVQNPTGPSSSIPEQPLTKSLLRRDLRSQASRPALRSAIGLAVAAGASLLAPGQAWAQCLVGTVTVQCDDTSTTDTTFNANPPNDRNYATGSVSTLTLTVDAGTTVSGNGLAIANTGPGGVAVTNNGAISVDAGNTPTAGGTAALSVTTTGGALTYTGGSITNNGAGNAFDAVQTGFAGSVSINLSGNVSAAAGEGITVRDTALSTGVSVTTNNVTALAAGMDAIDVLSLSSTNGNLTIVANGDLQAGDTGVRVEMFSNIGTGNIDITTNGSVNARAGIDAQHSGTGSVTVTTVGPVNTTTGIGILARSSGGDITVTAGDVTTTSTTAVVAQQTDAAAAGAIDVTVGNVSGSAGIFADNDGTGAIGITANGTVTSTLGDAITAFGNDAVSVTVADTVSGTLNGLRLVGGGAGAISVTGTGGFVGTVGNAVNILHNGSGTVTVDISGASSSGSDGIFVRDTALGRGISVTTGAVTSLFGASNAIDIVSLSSVLNGGGVTVVANGDLQASDIGVRVEMFSNIGTGNIDITTNGSVTARAGIDAQHSGTGSITVTTVGPVNTTTGNGIHALSTGGNVTVTAGDVATTAATAIVAHNVLGAPNSGTIDVTLTAGNIVTANAPAAFGIQTDSGQSSGTTTINVNGTINAGAAGISSTSTVGDIVTNIGVSGVIDPLIGIDQTTVSGAITVNTGGLVEGDNIGVRLTSSGAGAAGALTVNQAGTGTINSTVGVDLNAVDGALAVNNAGLIGSTTTAVRMTATGAGTGTILNSGTITGGTNVVLATLNNTAFTLTNTGTLNGAVNVTGSNVATSTMTNAAGGTANFGSGSSSFSGSLVNAGTANIGAGGTVTFLGNTTNSNRINFAGAGSFTTNGAMANSGIVNARNDLTGNVVTVAGNYTGGGQFFADYSTATATADRLNITGTATGNTNVVMNRVGPPTLIAGGFLPVVTVAPGAAANAFTSNAFSGTGLILESFGQNPANNSQFGVLQAINPSSASLGSLAYVAEAASMLLDEPISPYVTARTDAAAGDKRFSLWMRGTSGHTKQTIASSIGGGGFAFSSVSRVRTEHQAVQVGADFGILNIGGGRWNVHLGAFGGWYDGQARLSATERVNVDAPFAGAYFAASNGAFTIDATIRREWRNYDFVLPTLFGPDSSEIDGEATAGSIHASYRIGGRTGFAATPFLGYSHADGDIDDLSIDAVTTYSPGGHKTQVGRAGVRLSYRTGNDARVVLEPFASASALKNRSHSDQTTYLFGTPTTTFTLETATWENAMRYSAGIIGHARNGLVSAFLVGNIDDGSNLDGVTVNAGLRINF